MDGAAEGVRWIRVRFPLNDELRWAPPTEGWHIDGDTRRLDTSQSVVVLPLVTPIAPGDGGTAIVAGSHKQMARWLHDRPGPKENEPGCGAHTRAMNAFIEHLARGAVARHARARRARRPAAR